MFLVPWTSLSEISSLHNSAIQVIGNLLLEVTDSEGYSGEEAMRDLHLIGSALRYLPRMAQALEHNSSSIEFGQKKYKET
jgi:hypothetical protein